MAEDTCIFLISWRIRGDFAEIQIILGVGRLQNHDAVFRVEALFDGLQCALCEPLCDADSGEIADRLAQGWGVCVRPGAHCAPRLHKALGTEEQGAVRFSFGWYNTEEEADAAVTALREIAT